MSYASLDALIARFGEQTLIDLTDRSDPPAGAIDAAVLAGAVSDAEALIDGYLGVKYAVPLTPAPERVVAVACDLVRYRLSDDRPSDETRRRYEDALAWLKDVARGAAVLPGAPQPVSGGGGNLVQVTASQQVFSRSARP